MGVEGDAIVSTATVTQPVETATPKAPPPPQAVVIRRLESAAETAHERLIKKHLPAWVISGAINIGLVACLLLIPQSPPVKATDKVVSTSVEKEDTPPETNLTTEDPGLQSNLDAALPELQRVEEKTVDAAVTDDNIGQPRAPENDSTALALPGLTPDLMGTPGVSGDLGQVMQGLGGREGQSFHAFPGRSGATKSMLIKKGGGNAESERAVARGLAWLAKQQRADGSWVFDTKEDSKKEVVAATGLALLPFLAAGETHKSGQRYQKTVRSGLEYLIKCCPTAGPNAGKFTGIGNMYTQAIGTVALCEAYGMTRDKALLLPTCQAAINYIQRAQGANGSWGYQAGTIGDTSIVGWQIQALQAARLSKDVVVDKRVIDNAIRFLNLASAGSRRSAYGYNDNTRAQPGTALTAVGLLCRYYIDGWGPDNGGMAEGVQGLMKRSPNPDGTWKTVPDMYFYYYATQVVHFFEGEEWKQWNEGTKQQDGTRKGGMRDLLLACQNTKPGADEGSWEPEAGFIGRHCGRLGTTSLCLLTLEVYYRHLPLTKRTSTGDSRVLEGAR
jgi:hypothetical protein